MRSLSVVMVLAVLTACTGSNSDKAAVRTYDRVTVTDVPGKDGPVLCEGEVRESAPPQCDGPVISNWDWAKVWGGRGAKGEQFGDFCFSGRKVDGKVKLTTLPRPVGTCDAQEYLGFGLVNERGDGPQLCQGAIGASIPPACSGPPIINWDWDRAAGETRAITATYGNFYVYATFHDGTFTLTRPPIRPEDYTGEPLSEEQTHGATIPCPETCSGEPLRTKKELRRIRDEVFARAGGLSLVAGPVDGYVRIRVIVDEGGRLQKEFDEKYGVGTVQVTTALVEASPDL